MAISKLLLKWYEIEGRELPWRETRDPYRIWISEIILQQTRIQQGIDYYFRFIERFPDISSLARADIVEVLNIWQGLGYYSRARNLHQTALKVYSAYGGKFPCTFNEIIKLKGIGEYTAAAIASIAFGEVTPAIDGNVKRVVSRLSGSYDDPDKSRGLNKIREYLRKEIDPMHPGNFNQSLMDLGSLVCTPSNPACRVCPLASLCKANLRGLVHEIPVRNKVRKSINRYFYYLVIISGDKVLIKQRSGKDIWRMLYDFPLLESDKKLSNEMVYEHIEKKIFNGTGGYKISKESGQIIHILSHQKIYACFIHIETKSFPTISDHEHLIISREKISDFPLPRLIDRYLQQISL